MDYKQKYGEEIKFFRITVFQEYAKSIMVSRQSNGIVLEMAETQRIRLNDVIRKRRMFWS